MYFVCRHIYREQKEKTRGPFLAKKAVIRRRRNGDSGMSRRRSLRGKEKADAVEVEDVKGSLLERLFATDRFPCERINMYSTIDNLLCLRDALNETEEMAQPCVLVCVFFQLTL